MKNELWVAGYPSLYGGADLELDHNIDLWRHYGVEVHLVPMFGCDRQMAAFCHERGCTTHAYRPDIFERKIVASFCNGEFLSKLPEIIECGRPEAVIWFNCMTWTFEKELEAHRNGWITYYGFVSEYQKQCLSPQFQQFGAPVKVLEGYRPYFNPANKSQQIEFRYRPPEKWFGLGRISRDDANKFSSDMWNSFFKVCSPIPTKTFVLGYGPNAHQRCGPAPAGLDWQTWLPGEIPVREFYQRLHCVIHKTGGSRESYCRIVPECYAFGVPIIVEDDFAFPELVDDGVTGFRCKSSDEMSFRASQLAFDEECRKKMIFRAYEFLVATIADKEACWKPWRAILAEA